jgi:hypothetical protein
MQRSNGRLRSTNGITRNEVGNFQPPLLRTFQPPLTGSAVQGRELAFHRSEILAETIVLAHVACDRIGFIGRQLRRIR